MEIFRTFLTTMEIMAGSCARLFSALRTAISFSFFEDLGLGMVQEREGKIFPDTMQARDVLDILTLQCQELGVVIKCSQAVKSITRREDGFFVGCVGGSYHSK